MYKIFIYLMLVVIIGYITLKYTLKYGTNTEHFNPFPNRKTMDDVMDKYCKTNQNLDDYQYSGWNLDDSTTTAKCWHEKCETEKCYKLKPINPLFYGSIPDAYQWETKEFEKSTSNVATCFLQSNQHYKKIGVGDNCSNGPDNSECYQDQNDAWFFRSNNTCVGLEERLQCVTNNTVNDTDSFGEEVEYSCVKPDTYSCFNSFDRGDKCYIFSSNNSMGTLRWEETTAKKFIIDSNNTQQCVLKNTEYPYNNLVHVKNTDDNKSSTVTNNCFDVNYNGRRNCSIRNNPITKNIENEYGSNIHRLQNNEVILNDGYMCSDGSVRKYGYSSNDDGVIDGFHCNWLTSNCESCQLDESLCYKFDTTSREWDYDRYIQVYAGQDEECKFYQLKPEYKDVSINIFNNSGLNSDLEEQYTNTNNVLSSNGCSNAPLMNCEKRRILCKEFNADIRRSNQFVDVEYVQQWNATGDACEYYVNSDFHENYVHSGKSNLYINKSNLEAKCEISYDCPKGMVYNEATNPLGNHSCIRCDPNFEYFDVDSETCKPLGIKNTYSCSNGEYYDIEKTGRYNINTKSNNYGKSNNIVTIQHETQLIDSHVLLHIPNSSSNANQIECSPCPANTFMRDSKHISQECEVCVAPLRSSYNNPLYYVDSNQCKFCDPKMNYKIEIAADSKKSCTSCADVFSNALIDIANTTAKYDEGLRLCYLECNESTTEGEPLHYGRINENDAPQAFTSFKCVPICRDHHYLDSNTCVPCPKGKQRIGNAESCTSCVSGTYNDVSGESCKICPADTLNQFRSSVQSELRSVSPSNCYISCFKKEGGSVVPDLNKKGYYDVLTESYLTNAMEQCEKHPCSSTYRTHSNIEGGYLIIGDQTMIKNYAINGSSCEASNTSLEVFTSCQALGSHFKNGIGCCTNANHEITQSENVYKCACASASSPPPTNKELNSDTCDLECEEGTNNYNGQCVERCSLGQYVDPDTLKCSNCPVPRGSNVNSNVHSPGGFAQIDECKASCENGYNKVGGGLYHVSTGSYDISCQEKTTDCVTYRGINGNVNGFKSSYGYITSAEPIFWIKQTDIVPVSAITASDSECGNTPQGLELINSDNNHYVQCSNNTTYRSIGPYFACCSNGDILKQNTLLSSIKGCCKGNEIPVSFSNAISCCGEPSAADTNISKIYLDSSNVCRIECQGSSTNQVYAPHYPYSNDTLLASCVSTEQDTCEYYLLSSNV